MMMMMIIIIIVNTFTGTIVLRVATLPQMWETLSCQHGDDGYDEIMMMMMMMMMMK